MFLFLCAVFEGWSFGWISFTTCWVEEENKVEFSFALGDEGWGRRVTHLSITLYSIFTCQVVTA